ncbi:MAG: cytochrome c3 family protein [Deltaproteobacteria bacterium]|nr:cytochrome c3 family protein [Deltaproteobacteria bacterium]
MKNGTLYALALVIVSVFIFASANSQEDMEWIDNSVFKQPERVPSAFRHDDHNEKADIENCDECHHLYENGKKMADESSEDQRCSDCHELETSGPMPALMKAFHMNCKGCHLDRKKGPVTCGECHEK